MNSNVLLSILEKSKANKEIITVWQYNGNKNSLVGYVTEIAHEHFTLKLFTTYGKCDGLILVRTSQVKTIDFNDDFTRVMECVIQYSAIFDKPADTNFSIGYSEHWQMDALLRLAGNIKEIASFEINGNDYYTGFVFKISDEDFILNCVGKNGEDQGYAIYRIEDITEIRVNDLDNRRRLLLYNWRKASL